MKGFLVGAVGLAALAMAGSAAAQDITAADRADMQCFTFMAYVIGESEAATGAGTIDQETIGGMAAIMMYYLGRLEGRSPGKDWLQITGAYADTVMVDELMTHARRCADEMEEKGAAMVEFGRRRPAA